jgi:hypothetical protein
MVKGSNDFRHEFDRATVVNVAYGLPEDTRMPSLRKDMAKGDGNTLSREEIRANALAVQGYDISHFYPAPVGGPL